MAKVSVGNSYRLAADFSTTVMMLPALCHFPECPSLYPDKLGMFFGNYLSDPETIRLIKDRR